MEEIKNYILQSVFKHIPSNTIINRNSKIGDLINISPEVLRQRYCINNYLKFDKYNELIASFHKTLINNFEDSLLDSFYANLTTLKIKTKKANIFGELQELILGCAPDSSYYLTTKNKMQVYHTKSTNIEDEINHELLHMASTKYKYPLAFSGFSQANFKTLFTIGDSLNEGYTQYLSEKYFSKREDENYDSYTQNILIAKKIENIVGQKKMEELYFKADLKGLISEIAKYTTVDNAVSLIKSIDNVLSSERKSNPNSPKYKELRRNIADIYMEKQRQLLDAGKISEQDYEDKKIIHSIIYVKENKVYKDNAKLIRDERNLKIIDEEQGVIKINAMKTRQIDREAKSLH